MPKKYNFWEGLWSSLKSQFSKDKLIEHLKGKAVKLALKKLLGSVAMGGFKAWLLKYIVTNLFEEIAEPLVRMALNQVGYIYDKHDGKVIVKKMKKASEDGNESDYNDAVDDIFGRL